MNLPPNLPANTSAAVAAAQELAAEPRRGFDFLHFWHAILERLWIIVLCVLAGLFIALGYLARTPKLYQSHAVLEVDFQEPTMIAGEENSTRIRSMFLASQEALRTIEQNLTNLNLMARVVRSENLAEDGGRALLGSNGEADTKSAPAKSATPVPKSAGDNLDLGANNFTPLEEGLGRYLSRIVKPAIRGGTRLLDLYVTSQDPSLAQEVANAVGREYIRMSIERRATFSQESLRYMMEEEERLKANLQKSEAAVADYKAKNPDALQLGGGAASTGTQAGAEGTSRGGLVEDQLQELTSKVTSAKTDRVKLESELKQIEQIGDNVDALLNIPSIASAPTVVDRRKDVAQLEASVAGLAQRYKSNHPKMMAAQAALTEAKRSLRQAVLEQPSVLRNVLDQARAAENSLGGAAEQQQQAALRLNKAAIGYQELARQAETDRALYESVLRQIKETNLTKDVKTNAVSITEPALLPHMPVTPQPTKAILLGLLGGLAAGLGFVYFADVLDRSIKTVDQAEELLGLPVLAAVPERSDAGKIKTSKAEPGGTTYRAVAEVPEGPVAESIRNLRAALSLLGPEIERKVFLFTSALPAEGKSFTSTNYSLALAQQGYRVLLVDGDLRRPSLNKVFYSRQNGGGEDEAPGVIDCLVGEADLVSAVRVITPPTIELAGEGNGDVENTPPHLGQLSVLAGGRRAPNPAELLSGSSFGELIAEASRLYDRVVIDSAPVLAVSDTLLMVPHVQTVSLVLRAAKTPRNAVQRAINLLSIAGIRPAGLVLNRLPRRHGAGLYYYYASHGYGAGEGSYGRAYGRPAKGKSASVRS